MFRILLVDDDEPVRSTLRRALTRMGYQVREASNGKEAMRMCAQEAPDLVMTDIIMPEQEGLETIGAIRRLHPGVKVVAMSGGGRIVATDYLKTAATLGADGVLAKPFTTEEMTEILVKLLGAAGGGPLAGPAGAGAT